jgi:hypothetical protein
MALGSHYTFEANPMVFQTSKNCGRGINSSLQFFPLWREINFHSLWTNGQRETMCLLWHSAEYFCFYRLNIGLQVNCHGRCSLLEAEGLLFKAQSYLCFFFLLFFLLLFSLITFQMLSPFLVSSLKIPYPLPTPFDH